MGPPPFQFDGRSDHQAIGLDPFFMYLAPKAFPTAMWATVGVWKRYWKIFS